MQYTIIYIGLPTFQRTVVFPYPPAGLLAASDRSALNRFVEADLQAQATLGASAYLLPSVIPANQRDDVRSRPEKWCIDHRVIRPRSYAG
jgi:hypothetical protein